jgi:hypothetical protein
MKRHSNYISIFLKLLLLVLFIGYYSSITMFYHAHILANGIVITHSHPFKSPVNNKSPFQSHSHSSTAYNLIDQLNHINCDNQQSICDIQDSHVLYSEILHSYSSPFLYFIYFSSSQLRAPPAC